MTRALTPWIATLLLAIANIFAQRTIHTYGEIVASQNATMARQNAALDNAMKALAKEGVAVDDATKALQGCHCAVPILPEVELPTTPDRRGKS